MIMILYIITRKFIFVYVLSSMMYDDDDNIIIIYSFNFVEILCYMYIKPNNYEFMMIIMYDRTSILY